MHVVCPRDSRSRAQPSVSCFESPWIRSMKAGLPTRQALWAPLSLSLARRCWRCFRRLQQQHYVRRLPRPWFLPSSRSFHRCLPRTGFAMNHCMLSALFSSGAWSVRPFCSEHGPQLQWVAKVFVSVLVVSCQHLETGPALRYGSGNCPVDPAQEGAGQSGAPKSM